MRWQYNVWLKYANIAMSFFTSAYSPISPIGRDWKLNVVEFYTEISWFQNFCRKAGSEDSWKRSKSNSSNKKLTDNDGYEQMKPLHVNLCSCLNMSIREWRYCWRKVSNKLIGWTRAWYLLLLSMSTLEPNLIVLKTDNNCCTMMTMARRNLNL